jgi:hypothetical protein
MRGRLSLEAGKRVISHRLTDRFDVLQGEIPDVQIPIPNMTNGDIVTRAMFMAYHFSSFSPAQGVADPDKVELAGAMMGLLFNTTDYTRVFANNNELPGHCHKAGFRPVFRIIHDANDIRVIALSPRTQSFLGKFGAGMNKFLRDRSQQLVMLGPILLTIGKNIQIEGYRGRITRRIRSFMGTLGLESNYIIWTDATYPSISTMNSLGTYLSAAFFLRREISAFAGLYHLVRIDSAAYLKM